MWLAEEDIGDSESCDDSDEVGDEAADDCVACVFDTDTTEVDGKDVERGVGGALQNTAEAADE